MGRQHHGNGIVKTAKIFPTSKPIIISPPKHTHNRSKSIGKCGRTRCAGIGCHVCKSTKDKGYKGTYKLRSCDVGLNHRLISWRVVDNKGLHQLNYVGVSATQVLDQLKNHYYQDFDDDDDADDDGKEEDGDQFGVYGDYEDEGGVRDGPAMRSIHVEDAIVREDDEMGEDGIVDGEDEDEDEDEVEVSDDEMGDFCDVGYFVIEQLDGDEDWCLVGEL